jgi:hypothetical protein
MSHDALQQDGVDTSLLGEILGVDACFTCISEMLKQLDFDGEFAMR